MWTLMTFLIGLFIGSIAINGYGYAMGRRRGLREGVKVGLDLWHRWYPAWVKSSSENMDDDERWPN